MSLPPDWYSIKLPSIQRRHSLIIRNSDWQHVYYKKHDKYPPVSIHPVCENDPLFVRKALENIARYFKREFQYDFLQYDSLERQSDLECQGFLFEIKTGYKYSRAYFYGGCCFRYRKWEGQEGWALQWIWMHPFERSKGNWKYLNAFFETLFGKFNIEPPLSPIMRSFVDKYRPDLLEEGKHK